MELAQLEQLFSQIRKETTGPINAFVTDNGGWYTNDNGLIWRPVALHDPVLKKSFTYVVPASIIAQLHNHPDVVQ